MQEPEKNPPSLENEINESLNESIDTNISSNVSPDSDISNINSSLSNLLEDANRLLRMTHEYCTTFSATEIEVIKARIDTVNKKLAKTLDANEIIKLSTALKTLHDIYASLHDRAVVSFMASYRPLTALIRTENERVNERMNNLETTHTTQDEILNNSSDELTETNTLDSVDISNLYKPYED